MGRWLPFPLLAIRYALFAFSRNDVGQKRILDPQDQILQLKLALLQPRHLYLVAAALIGQRGDGGVQIAVLLNELRELCAQRLLVGIGHVRCGRGLAMRRPFDRSSPQRRTLGQSYPNTSSMRPTI